MPNEPPWDLIAAYTTGELLTTEQQQTFRLWQLTDPDAPATLQQAQRMYAGKAPPTNPLAAWHRIHQIIQNQSSK